MSKRARTPGGSAAVCAAARLCAALVIGLAAGPGATAAKIHQCVDPKTRAVTLSQLECPGDHLPSPAELAASAAAERTRSTEADADATRRRADQQLLVRFPDRAAHRNAEREELEPVARHVRSTIPRLDELLAKRKRLEEEAEFHRGKPLPAPLQRQFDASDGSLAGLAETFRADEASVREIVARYEAERVHLERLWADNAHPDFPRKGLP